MSLFLPEVFLLSLVFEANIREMSLDPWSYKRSLEKREQRRCVCVGGLGGRRHAQGRREGMYLNFSICQLTLPLNTAETRDTSREST